MNFVCTIVGIPETIKRLKRYREAGEIAAENAAIEAANLILEESLKLCPIDTGYLRSTGKIVVQGSGYGIQVTVGYSADYAVYVHENLEAYHNPPTQAQFLSEVLRRYRGDISQKIKSEVHAALRRAKENAQQKRAQVR